MFAGLDSQPEELETLREAARQGPLIFCPSHRSHVDYLVLSYVLVSAGMIPPLVAAGENMNIFPLGSMFRGGGAFYIRRSFATTRSTEQRLLPIYATSSSPD